MSVRFGRNVRRFRLERGMTMERLGQLAGYGRSMICEIEKGEVMPASGKVPRLADALGKTVADLYEGVQ